MPKFGTEKPPAGTTTLCRHSGAPSIEGEMSIFVITPTGNGNAGRLSTWSVPALLVSVMRSAPQQASSVVVVVLVVVLVVVGSVVVDVVVVLVVVEEVVVDDVGVGMVVVVDDVVVEL